MLASEAILQRCLLPALLLLSPASPGLPSPPGRAEPQTPALRGSVIDASGPVAGAVVRIQTTARSARTDERGRFVLPVEDPGADPYPLTAWAPGYYCAGPVPARAGGSAVEIELKRHTATDNPDYEWLPPESGPEAVGEEACSACHSRRQTDLAFDLPFDEWRLDAHARSALNPRFVSLYAGTDLAGRRSPPTRFVHERDYGRTPLLPDPGEAYYGPGYRLDFPATAGSCAACHAPALAVAAPYDTDPLLAADSDQVADQGTPCDLCHKVWDVRLNPETGLPWENLPGILSIDFRRPPPGEQLFIGPLDDAAPGDDTYAPIQRQSAFCAPCHFGVFWDTVVYNSFGEWLASPYSDPASGRTCQDCHMPPGGASYFVRPDRGGRERPPETIFSHRMPGGGDRALLAAAVALGVRADRRGRAVRVEVAVTNDRTGHHVPSGSPLRQVILLVRASRESGGQLEQTAGERLPSWLGVGDPGAGYYAGRAGKVFAKVLEETWTGIAPTAAYWNPTRVVSDNRLAALATDTSAYTFAAPSAGTVTVEVSLLYRRAPIELMEQKGWAVGDILMAREVLTLVASR